MLPLDPGAVPERCEDRWAATASAEARAAAWAAWEGASTLPPALAGPFAAAAFPRLVRMRHPDAASVVDVPPDARVTALVCLAPPEEAVAGLLALTRTTRDLGAAPLTRQYTADALVWSALADLGPLSGSAAEAARTLLVDDLTRTRFEEEEARVGVDQEGAAAITAALVSVGGMSAEEGRRVLAWAREEYPRVRVNARWEEALEPAAREVLAAELLTQLGGPDARFATFALGRLAVRTTLAPLVARALSLEAAAASGREREEAWRAVLEITSVVPDAWSRVPDTLTAQLPWEGAWPGAALAASGAPHPRRVWTWPRDTDAALPYGAAAARWIVAPRLPDLLPRLDAVPPAMAAQGLLGRGGADPAVASALLDRALTTGDPAWVVVLHGWRDGLDEAGRRQVSAQPLGGPWGELRMALAADPLLEAPGTPLALRRSLDRGCDPRQAELLAPLAGVRGLAAAWLHVCPEVPFALGSALRGEPAQAGSWGDVLLLAPPTPEEWRAAVVAMRPTPEHAAALVASGVMLGLPEAWGPAWLVTGEGGAVPLWHLALATEGLPGAAGIAARADAEAARAPLSESWSLARACLAQPPRTDALRQRCVRLAAPFGGGLALASALVVMLVQRLRR